MGSTIFRGFAASSFVILVFLGHSAAAPGASLEPGALPRDGGRHTLNHHSRWKRRTRKAAVYPMKTTYCQESFPNSELSSTPPSVDAGRALPVLNFGSPGLALSRIALLEISRYQTHGDDNKTRATRCDYEFAQNHKLEILEYML
jgi:hypothetical protein